MKWLAKFTQKQFSYMLTFLLVILIILGFLSPWGENNYFTGNIVPELIGVCIELLIIIIVFNKWQEKEKKEQLYILEQEEKNQLITFEKRLREYLIFFLKHNFQSLPHGIRIGTFFGKEHHTNIQNLDSLIKYLQSQELSGNNIFSVKSHCLLEAETLGNLLPVASQLTDEHFKAWCRIVYFANKISISDNPPDIQKYTIDILQNMKRFDTASFANKLYVGA